MKIDKNSIFLSGKYVDLKVLDEQDIDNSNWYGWFNNKSLTQGTQHFLFPNSKSLQLDFLKSINGSNNFLQLGIVPKDYNRIVGVVSLKNINWVSRLADHSQIIEEKFRDINLVIESNMLIFDHAFNSLGLNRINGGSIDKNQTIFMQRFFGFKDEGISRKAVFTNGKFVDIYKIGLIREEYTPVVVEN